MWKRRLYSLWQSSWADRLLLFEAFTWLGLARLAVLTLPMRRLAPFLGCHMQESAAETTSEQLRAVKRIARAVNIASRHTPWNSNCLAQAIAAQRMLLRCHTDSTMYFGVAKQESTQALEAHAWLRSGTVMVTGAQGRQRFTVVSTFACIQTP